MAHLLHCPACGHPLTHLSSQIGSSRPCAGCGGSVELPVPADLQALFDAGDRKRQAERVAWDARWAHHDHIADPQPYGDFNGFFDAVRAYARERGLEMAEVLRTAGIFSCPPTESYGETLLALSRVSRADLRQLPPQVQEALRRVRDDIARMLR